MLPLIICYIRYPNQYEFDEVYKMIEDNTAQIVFGQSANDKEGFIILSFLILGSFMKESFFGLI